MNPLSPPPRRSILPHRTHGPRLTRLEGLFAFVEIVEVAEESLAGVDSTCANSAADASIPKCPVSDSTRESTYKAAANGDSSL